jgi:hypothetical protein
VIEGRQVQSEMGNEWLTKDFRGWGTKSAFGHPGLFFLKNTLIAFYWFSVDLDYPPASK